MPTMPPLPDPAEKHSAESRRAMSQRFIMEARIELEAGNRMQAGEKAWNALAQYYKLIADSRGWNHDATRELESMGRHLVAEFPDLVTPPFINGLSDAYHRGHENFYENRLYDDEVLDVIEGVEYALPILETMASEPLRPFRIDSRSQLRRLRLLTGNEDLQVGDESPVGFSLVAESPPSSEL